MTVCAGIKRDGGRCTALALPGESYCYGHHPTYAETRRRNAAKSHKGRASGGEIRDIKGRLSRLADDVLKGSVDRATAAVASQVLNVYLRAVSVELKVREQEQILERVEELEAMLTQRKGA